MSEEIQMLDTRDMPDNSGLLELLHLYNEAIVYGLTHSESATEEWIKPKVDAYREKYLEDK